MEMNQDEIKRLVDRYLNGTCSEEEARIVNSHFNKITAETPEMEPLANLSKRKRRVWENLGIGTPKNSRIRSFYYISIAAALLLIFSGWWFFKWTDSGKVHDTTLAKQQEDVAPGSNGATLTFSDGRKIILDSTRLGAIIGRSLTYNDGSPIRGSVNLPVNGAVSIVAATEKGQVYTFILPDGSKVWLNADSRLTFPSRFAANERQVSLEGEGYFEISEQRIKNKDNRSAKLPFIVSSQGQEVKVTGTKFNIAAYRNEKTIKTTLLEGGVLVNGQLLKPGQQSSLFTSGDLKIEEADVMQAIGWQQGDFVFRGETLEEVFRTVARWYNVEVRYQRNAARYITVGGTVSRSRSISAVLDLMEKTGKVTFKVSGNVITVM
ncbi:FecR domain-containing protein [Sphingobacterium sp. DR205]|uniref:FecR family protein n=1 Tax=Sphingobacterium sp. DR205 TaxID=2713573 RepID=UPI0013E4E3E0|nr:FecR domain-containing protein [Sphingobacterium sp. DR205]QIH31465.1 FecR family protein [Sphingobacterium sp. DR205]